MIFARRWFKVSLLLIHLMKKLPALLLSLILLTSCNVKTDDTVETTTEATTTELIIEDLEVGTGEEAKAGDTVEVHYVGTFTDGSTFDSSRDRGQTFSFTLGAGQVIQGWDEGVAGMKVGGLRKLTIPSDLAYGDNDYGPIPGGSTLIFEVELVSIQ